MGTVVEGPNCPETCVLDSETNSTQELAQSNSLAAGEELVTGSKVPSHLLQLEIRTLVEFVLHSFILVELFFCKKIPLSRRVRYVMDGWFSGSAMYVWIFFPLWERTYVFLYNKFTTQKFHVLQDSLFFSP